MEKNSCSKSINVDISCRWNASENKAEDGQLVVIGSLVLAIPWIIHYAHLTEECCTERTVEAIKLTHPAPALIPYIKLYASALHSVINGRGLHQVCRSPHRTVKPYDRQVDLQCRSESQSEFFTAHIRRMGEDNSFSLVSTPCPGRYPAGQVRTEGYPR